MSEGMRVRSKKGTAAVWRFMPGQCAPPEFYDRPVQGIYWSPLGSEVNPSGKTWLVMHLPSGPKDVNEGDYVLRFEDGSYDVVDARQFTTDYEMVTTEPPAAWPTEPPAEPDDPFALQFTLSVGRVALLDAILQSTIAALRDRGDKNMADMLDNGWFIAFGEVLGAQGPQGGQGAVRRQPAGGGL